MHITFFIHQRHELEKLMPPHTTISGAYCLVLLHDQMLLALCRKEHELLENDIISFRTIRHPITVMMCKACCRPGTGRCWHTLFIFKFLFACMKDPLQRCQSEYADAISKAVMASLCHLSTHNYRAVIDCWPMGEVCQLWWQLHWLGDRCKCAVTYCSVVCTDHIQETSEMPFKTHI
jgi:hypothetical protein